MPASIPNIALCPEFAAMYLLDVLCMNLMATSLILSLSSASRTNAELPSPSSATLPYRGWSRKGSGWFEDSRTEVGVVSIWLPPASLHVAHHCS